MQRTKTSRRPATRIAGVLLALGLLIGACTSAPTWEEATSSSGRYVAEFPGSPETSTNRSPAAT